MAQSTGLGGLPRWLLRALAEHEVALGDFSGGLNVRDPLTALTANEFPYGYNVTLNERGQPSKRLGTSLYNPLDAWGGSGNSPQYLYWSAALNKTFMFLGGILKWAQGNGAWTNAKTGLSTTGGAFVDFNGQLVFVDNVNGVATWDGATWTVRAAGVKGTCIAVWQNKVWVAGDPANPTRVWWSAAGDATTWTIATDWVDLREGGDEKITALAPSAGMDILGRAGLLVFKNSATHRINNSATGAYTTLSLWCGAVSNRAVCAIGDTVGHLDARGIWVTGASAGNPVKVSGKLEPLFGPMQGQFGKLNAAPGYFAAVGWRDRMLFEMQTDTATLLLEYHPQQHWIVPHVLPSVLGQQGGGYIIDQFSRTLDPNGAPLLRGCGSATGAGTVRVFDPAAGTDVSTASFATPVHVDSLLRTRPMIPNAAQRAAAIRARLIGRGQVTVAPVVDFAQAAGTARALTMDVTSKWLTFADFKRAGFPRELQLEIKGAAGDDTIYTPPGLTNLITTAPAQGGWAVSNILTDFVAAGDS